MKRNIQNKMPFWVIKWASEREEDKDRAAKDQKKSESAMRNR